MMGLSCLLSLTILAYGLSIRRRNMEEAYSQLKGNDSLRSTSPLSYSAFGVS